MDTRQTTSEEDDLETSSDGSSSQNSASNQSASVAPVMRQSDPDIVISKNVSSSGSAAAGASRSGDGHQILISSSSSINVRGGKAEMEGARSVLQKEAPPSGVASKSEVLLRPPPRLKKLAKMRQAEQMHRTRNEAKNFQPVLQYPQ